MAVNVVVQIEIREKGAGKTAKQVKGIGINAKTAAIAVTGLVAALGLIAGIRGLARIATDAVQAAAAFETYEVQLTALLGSQEAANVALENFVTLSSRTPFGVAAIVEGATALGAAALGNRERLEELVQTSANLAAVTGLSFQEASSNLARALSAGIGAADLFREKGVRGLIESIGEIPDATKLSAVELDQAFRDIFGADGGTFGAAARDLSLTLGGALSNIGDASANLRVSLGQTFSPVVINAANSIFIPFLEEMRIRVDENADAFTNLAASGLSALVEGFILAAETGLFFAEGLQDIKVFVATLTGALFDAQLGIAEFDLSLNSLANSLGLVSDADLAFQQREVNQLAAGVDAIAADVGATARSLEGVFDGARTGLERLRALTSSANLAQVIERTSGGPSAEDLRGDPDAEKVTALLARQRVSAAKELAALNRQISLDALDADERALALIDEQIAKAVALGAVTGDQLAAERAINGLIAQRVALQEEQDDSSVDEIGAALKNSFNENIGAAFQGDIAGAGKNFVQNLGTQLRADSAENMQEGFEDALKGLKKGLSETFNAIAGDLGGIFGGAFEGLSGALGSALGAGLQFASGLALDAITGGGGNSSTSSASLSRSAVDSTQAFRGIVTGPRELAVAQVGDSIAGAIDPMIQEQGVTNILLGQIRDRLSGGTGATSPGQVASADSLAFNPPA